MSYRKTALTFMLYFTWLCGQAAAQHLPLAQGKEGKSDDVEVKGGISNAVLTAGNRTWFFLSVSNHSPKPISVVRLRELRAEGLKLVSHCWGDSEDTLRGITSGGSSDSNTQTPPAILPSDCELIAQELQPGQSAVVSGQLLAEDPHEKQAVIADVSWRRDDNSLSGQFAVLGETAVQSSFEHWRSSATYDLAKDLAWPIVLLMLGAGAGLYDKSREDKRNQVAELRAQTIQTWNSMLPESHKLATNYYMPIEAAAVSLIDEIDERAAAMGTNDKSQQVANEERAFYYLLLLFRRLRALANDKGGWYFKNRIGEELVTACLDNFRIRVLYEPVEVQAKLSLAVGHIEPTEKLGEFRIKLQKQGPEGNVLKEVHARYVRWLTSDECETAVRNLKGMRVLLSYEMNRPYEYWYGRREKIEIDPGTEKTIREVAKQIHTEIPDFVLGVDKYLADFKVGL